MSMPKITCCTSGATRRGLIVGGLVTLLVFLLPMTALAAPPDPHHQGSDECAQCHTTQTSDWESSPHAQTPKTGVTCEVCHGPYVPDHPQNGAMQLQVGASRCQDCHTATYQQWHETAHAGASVQCASCHVPHTQETRLAGEELCASCHRKIVDNWTHHNADVHCADCHLASPSTPEPATDHQVVSEAVAPNHSFKPAVNVCAECHGQRIHDQTFSVAAAQVDCAQMPVMTERARELAFELEDAKHTNRTLQTLSVVSLGFGLGSGGVLGIIFACVVGYLSQRRAKS